jgi:hypothetical protein
MAATAAILKEAWDRRLFVFSIFLACVPNFILIGQYLTEIVYYLNFEDGCHLGNDYEPPPVLLILNSANVFSLCTKFHLYLIINGKNLALFHGL